MIVFFLANFLIRMIKLGIFLVVALCLAKIGESARYAHCSFHGDRDAKGHMCLKEDDDGQIYGRFDVHVTGGLTGPFGVHVHSNAPRGSKCRKMGPHHNLGDRTVDEGNIGTFKLDVDAIHDMDFKLDSNLNLNLYREDEKGIIGRGVKIHLGNGRSACCKLKSDNAVMFEAMKANVAKKGHKTN